MDVDIAQSGNVNSQQSRNGDDYMLPNNVIEYQTDEDMWEHGLPIAAESQLLVSLFLFIVVCCCCQ